MKHSKYLMLGTAVALTLLPLSLSAVTTDELVDKIHRVTRACPAPQIIIEQEPANTGWFSSLCQKANRAVGNALRTAGDALRTEGDESAAGHLKTAAKDGFFAVLSAKVGFSLDSVKDKVCNSLGNGLRAVGEWFKGEATQTTTRVILDSLDLKKSSTNYQVENALKIAAKAVFKANAVTAFDDYNAVVEGLVKRGYTQVKGMDVNAVYLNALAEEELNATTDLSCSAFVQAVQAKGFNALKNVNAVKEASMADKLNVMDKYLQDAYKSIKLKQDFDKARNNVIAVPAA